MSARTVQRPAILDQFDERAQRTLAKLVELLASDAAPTSVHDPERAWRVHIADSLAGIAPGMLENATLIADVGAGAGLPGLALAAALPAAEVELIESTSRKAEFIAEAIAACGVANARVIADRAETWAAVEGRERYDAVTARAVGRLSTLAELASPLLRDGGALVCWKGRRDRGEEKELARASERLAIKPVAIRSVGPYAGSRNRHIHLLRKNGPTPEGLPRRPGIAKKKPFGSESTTKQTFKSRRSESKQ